MLAEFTPRAYEQAQMHCEAEGIAFILHHPNQLTCISEKPNNPDRNRWGFLMLFCFLLLSEFPEFPVLSNLLQTQHCNLNTEAWLEQCSSSWSMPISTQLISSWFRHGCSRIKATSLFLFYDLEGDGDLQPWTGFNAQSSSKKNNNSETSGYMLPICHINVTW